MHRALLVSRDLDWPLTLALSWADAGDSVTVVLLDGTVASARRGHEAAPALQNAVVAGLAVVVESRALQLRAIPSDRLIDGLKIVDLDEVADLIADGSDRTVWL